MTVAGTLKPEHEIFAQCIAQGMKPIDAYRAAGFKGKAAAMSASASRLLNHAKVRARVAELSKPVFDEVEVTTQNVQREMALLAFRRTKTYSKFLASGDLNDVTSEQSAAIDAVKTITTPKGEKRIEVKFADKMQPLNSLARILGMLKDGPEVSMPVTFTVEFAQPPKKT